MEKVNSSVALFRRKHLFVQGADKTKEALQDKLLHVEKESTLYYYQGLEYKKPSLETSRRFKIALVASYTFLISIFGVVVYIANLLDPKFPF